MANEGLHEDELPEEAVTGQLRGFVGRLNSRLSRPRFFVAPDIPTKKLANAFRRCQIPPGEIVLAVLDCTALGSAKNCLVFGLRAIYYHNAWHAKRSGPGSIPYKEFPEIRFSPGQSWEVHLGHARFLNLPVGSVPNRPVIQMLNRIKRLAAGKPPPPRE